MFERRLKILLLVLTVPLVVVCTRLFQLQVLRADGYRDSAQKMLLRPVHEYPFIRGDITDHEGRRLAFDAPVWDICVHYGLLVQDRAYLRAVARKRYPLLQQEEAAAATLRDIQASWGQISTLTGTSLEELNARCETIRRRVAAIKLHVETRRRVETVVQEEQMVHPVVQGLDQNQQVLARERLNTYEWIEIVAAQKRRYAGGPAVGHLLGKMGEVSAELIKSQDPKDKLEELAAYALGERRGVSGCEALGESWLRGRRGRIQKDIEGRMVETPIEPLHGRAMRLTIDLPLQQAIYGRLKEAVESVRAEETGDVPVGTGGSVVILDIPSREILAMVDYPAPDPNATLAEYREMAADMKTQPLLFRSVRGQYPPGSTVKPMLLAGAFTDGKVGLDTRFHCDGMLLRDPPRWRCTGIHGDVDPVYAVQHSCNVFFCRVGERLELEGIGRWMSLFGLGRVAGTGLIEEVTGRLSTASGVGPARNAAIGQGDVLATPLQVANMTATIASGVYRPATLWAEGTGSRPAARLPIGDAAWRVPREGMFRAVNASGGTAYDRVTLEDAGDAVVLGKTGSAQASRKVLEWLYTCHLPDGTVVEKSAASADDLKRQLPGAEITGGRPSVKWPPPEVDDPTHAWFAGYVSSRSNYLQDSNPRGLHVAIVVLVEYGGHGGSAAGPVARDMLQMLVDRQNGRSELDAGGQLE